MPLRWVLGVAVLCAYLAYARSSLPLMGDFKAFYCAGSAVRAGGDPYRYGALAPCEQRLTISTEPEPLRFPVMPVPLPGYAIAPFVPLSLLPFPAASAVWVIILCGATWLTVVMMARLTKLPKTGVAAALLPVNIGLSLMLGQPTPLVMLALVAAASLLRLEKDRSAAVAASLTMVEPHIGIGACAALFIFRQRTRGVLLFGAIIALLVTFATVGVHGALEYVTAVVPAHALANATEGQQLSLTSLLWLAGVNVTDAVRYGDIMFIAMVMLGVAVSRRLANLYRDAGMLILVPPAFAMFGGVHVHLPQLIVVLLPILALLSRVRASRPVVLTAIALLMMPWHILVLPALMLLGPLLTGIMIASLRRSSRQFYAIAIPIGVLMGAIVLVALGQGPRATVFLPHEYLSTSLVQQEWQDYVRAMFSNTDLLSLWLRMPSWAGAAVGLGVLTYAAAGGVVRASKPSPQLGRKTT